jgi:hypothetical protein
MRGEALILASLRQQEWWLVKGHKYFSRRWARCFPGASLYPLRPCFAVVNASRAIDEVQVRCEANKPMRCLSCFEEGEKSMIIKRAFLAMGAIALSSHCAFAACGMKDVIFADEFNHTIGEWTQGAGLKIDGGVATLSVRKGFGMNAVVNSGFLMRGGHICVVTTYPTLEQAGKVSSPTTGIVFGAKGYWTLYAFEVTAMGAYALVQSNNNNWTNVIDWTNTSALKKGFGAENQIEATIDQGIVTLFINRQKVNSSRVHLPEGGWQVGLLATTDIRPNMDVPFQFRNFVVSRTTP